MKLYRKLIAALCLALIACVAVLPVCALAQTAVTVERNTTLWVDISKLTLRVGETKAVKLTWKSKSGQLYYSWDNAAVIDFKKSGVWDGDTTTLYIKGLAEGQTTVRITNSVNSDMATIDVTVIDEDRQQEVADILGLTVKSANVRLSDKLKAVTGGYSNGYVRAVVNDLDRIRDITLTSFSKRYTLFTVYPGMKFKTAAAQLKKLGWKQAKKRGTSVYYLNEEYLCRAICLDKSGSVVAGVRYYVP